MINHQHKFIFIHIPRTGGTSIEEVFSHKARKYGKHQTLKTLEDQNLVPEDYFKFSFVRNPWSLTVSQYHFKWKSPHDGARRWRKKHEKFSKLSFGEWVSHPFFQSPTIRSVDIAIRGGNAGTFLEWVKGKEVKVDFIGRFENLQQDFNVVCEKIGIPYKKLPHKFKTKHKHYTEYYDDETREIVAKKYAKDIKYFGYEFGE